MHIFKSRRLVIFDVVLLAILTVGLAFYVDLRANASADCTFKCGGAEAVYTLVLILIVLVKTILDVFSTWFRGAVIDIDAAAIRINQPARHRREIALADIRKIHILRGTLAGDCIRFYVRTASREKNPIVLESLCITEDVERQLRAHVPATKSLTSSQWKRDRNDPA